MSDHGPGLSMCQLSTELRKLYLFRLGDPTAEKLEDKKTNELLITLLESLEPREAEVVMGIFKKDQGLKELNYNFVKEIFPDLLP
jgi:DNA-directed RNA polymerase specialized sigma subunit